MSACEGCQKPLPCSKKTGRPRKFCGAQACHNVIRRKRYGVSRADSHGNCPRCDMPVEVAPGFVCRSCSSTVNRRIAKWLEDEPKPLPPGAVVELAAELGVSGWAISQRISRLRRGLLRVSP